MKNRNPFLAALSVLVLSVCVGVGAHAQRKAPGYMGKRFLLKYDQGISWSLGGDARGIPNLFYTLQGDWAVTTKYSVGAEYSFMTRKYEKELGQIYDYYDYYNTSDYYRLDRTFMHKVGIYGKLFSQRNGHLAPAGPYFSMGLNLYFVQGKYSLYGSDNYSGFHHKQNQFSFDFGPSIGGGKQYIVANRMVISVDLRATLPLIGLARTINYGANIESNTAATASKLESLSLNRWTLWPNAQANFIELRIGLGTLL